MIFYLNLKSFWSSQNFFLKLKVFFCIVHCLGLQDPLFLKLLQNLWNLPKLIEKCYWISGMPP